VKYPFRIAESAAADFEGILVWYKWKDVPDVGRKHVSEILEQVKMLADFPKMGRVVPEFNQEAIRELIHRPYRIVYRFDGAEINLVRVWRCERLMTAFSHEELP
jgi:plasmid stabilization system protein ParE